mgnify:CR=1 FL=1
MCRDPKPLTPDMLRGITQLTPEEIRNNADWMFAPVLVAANADRHIINFNKAKLWAKIHNLPVFVPGVKVLRSHEHTDVITSHAHSHPVW